MQKVVYVEDDDLEEINDYLADGWTVKDFKTCSTNDIGYAYFIIVKNKTKFEDEN